MLCASSSANGFSLIPLDIPDSDSLRLVRLDLYFHTVAYSDRAFAVSDDDRSSPGFLGSPILEKCDLSTASAGRGESIALEAGSAAVVFCSSGSSLVR